jgi:hypothetical protein
VDAEVAPDHEVGGDRADSMDGPVVYGNGGALASVVENPEQRARPHEAVRHGHGRDER